MGLKLKIILGYAILIALLAVTICLSHSKTLLIFTNLLIQCMYSVCV